MYGSGFYSQNGKPTSFVFIASAAVFILSLLGIAFLVVGLVALVSNISGSNVKSKNGEIFLEEKIINGFTDIQIRIQNAGYLYRISKKKNVCGNISDIESIFSQCNPKILTSDDKTLMIQTKKLNLSCDNDEKKLFWSSEWIISSSTIKFDENYVIKILYSIKTCTSSKDKFINKILLNSTIESISGFLVFVDENNIIEKEYKNCSFALKELDNSIKPCIEIRNASIPNDLKKTPINFKSGLRKGFLNENSIGAKN
ncbi:hypothetical protein BpHYR1_045940 [Brachionus plicatilis]|uniref:Uncharacterized protein n=1 Tax=Brachionus plicatilis TaxID=10195 RepID=A0A3M7T6Z1_BRAPC|nr:hypothetical protein BpHYR1_045940 [Brachionus plicatilis]